MNKKKILVLVAIVVALSSFFYRYSPRKFEFLGHYDKIGAHRVNSLDKLASSLSYFDAIELDLVYVEHSDILDVVHPPAPSTGLYFSRYVAALDGATPFLWLDIKNLNEANVGRIFQQVHTILESHNYPIDKVLIETRYPKALPRFANEGYKTSFYLPQQLYTLDEQALTSTMVVIDSVLQHQPELAISTSYVDYNLIRMYFPERSKYLWSLSHRKFGDYSLVRDFLNDETVQLVLVRYKPF